jgi:outer membrane protein TolC
VANNYYSVLVNRQQMNVIDTNIKNVKVVEKIISDQYKNGLAKKIDVDRIKVNLTNLQTQRAQILNGITQLENQLKYSMGMPVETVVILPQTELAEIKTLPEIAESIDMSNRTELKIANVQKELYTLDRKAKVSEYYPTLSFEQQLQQRQNVILAQEIYRSTQNNYNNGLAALTDLLDTENALTEAQNSYTQALLNYKIAEIQLIKSNGNIKSLL